MTASLAVFFSCTDTKKFISQALRGIITKFSNIFYSPTLNGDYCVQLLEVLDDVRTVSNSSADLLCILCVQQATKSCINCAFNVKRDLTHVFQDCNFFIFYFDILVSCTHCSLCTENQSICHGVVRL